MQRYRKRWISILAVLGTLLCIVSGCGKEEPEEVIEITLMHGWGGTLKTHNTMQAIYDQFSRGHKNIELISVPYSDSSIAVEKANDMLAVGKMPDIISTNGLSYYIDNAVKRGKALDLMPYIEADEAFASEIHPSVYEVWTTADGSLYTIPDALELAGYWYNKKHMEEAGITDESGEVRLPKSWEEFADMTERLGAWAAKTEGVDVCALDTIQTVENLFFARLAGEPGGIEAVRDGTADVDAKALGSTFAGIALLYDYSRDVDSIENARQNFMVGESILYFNGVWESDTLSDSTRAEEFAYAAYPAGEQGKTLSYVSPASGYVLARQKDKKKEEASVCFLKYMLSEEVQLKIALSTGQAPLNPNIDRDQVIREDPLFGEAMTIADNADIQINAIRSMWSEQKVDIVGRYIQQRRFSGTDAVYLAEELNRMK